MTDEASMAAAVEAEHEAGPYATLTRAVDAQMAQSYRSKLLEAPADKVAAAAVERAVTARPRRRYVVTGAWDAYLRMQFGRSNSVAGMG